MAQIKDVFLPWYNAYRFFVQNVLRLEAEAGRRFVPSSGRESGNVLDHWIHSATDSLVLAVRAEMAAYRLYTVVPLLLKFIDGLTNIYVRYNRKRLKGARGDADCRTALATLYHVSHGLTSSRVTGQPGVRKSTRHQRIDVWTGGSSCSTEPSHWTRKHALTLMCYSVVITGGRACRCCARCAARWRPSRPSSRR